MSIRIWTLMLLTWPITALPRHVPVLTVCDALQRAREYRGREVIVVGVRGWTIDGAYLRQNCLEGSTGARQTVEEVIGLPFSSHAPRLPPGFRWHRAALNSKFREAQSSTKLSIAQNEQVGRVLLPPEKWVAVYGILESPKTSRAPTSRGASRETGAGRGPSGSGKVALLSREGSEYDLGGAGAGQ